MKHVYSLQEKIKAGQDFTDLTVLLSDLYKELLPIPNGFIISHSGVTKLASNSTDSHIRDSISKEIIDQYESISGLTESYVNIFVFIKSNDNNQIIKDLCAYQVKGIQKIIFSIEDVINEMQTNVLKQYSNSIVNILILKSNNCDSFGYAFSKNVLNNSDETILIEAAYGIPVNNLNIEYDTYIVNKNTEKILEKHIAEQKFMYIRGHDALPYKQIEVSVAWQKKQKIDDKHIKSLTKTIKIISEELHRDYEIHWMLDNGKIWIYYINQIDYVPKKSTEDIIFDTEIDETEIEINNAIPEKTAEQIEVRDNKNSEQIEINYQEDDKLSDTQQIEDITLSAKHNQFLDQVNQNSFIIHFEQTELPQQIFKPITDDQDVATNLNENLSSNYINKAENITVENNTRKEFQKNVIYDHMDNNVIFKQRPLIEGRYYRGDSVVVGKATFNYESPSEDSILILEGFEDIRADLKVRGFIIVEPSEILAIRLYEHFKIPIITGAPLANRLLKEGEPIRIDPQTGGIYVSDPNATNNIEISSISNSTEGLKTDNINKVTNENSLSQETFEITEPNTQIDLTIQLERQTHEGIEGESLSIPVEPKKEYIIQADVKSDISESSIYIAETNKEDKQSILESILNYVTEDEKKTVVENNNLDVVQGISESDQTKLWANSLQKLVRTSSEVNPQQATTSIDSINYELNKISNESKEFNFDIEESYIHEINTPKRHKKYLDFVPTISKVYVHLIDEVVDRSLANYDGAIFSFTQDMPVGINLLLQNLQIIGLEKKVLVICPPYESQVMLNFLVQIHNNIRSKFKNLSLILPDYRNKKDIVQTKQLLNKVGLKRSSTFFIYANVSRMINVFRLEEIMDNILVDGRYYDLFRLKMNMLGVEKLTASTKFVEGMRNLVKYLSQRDSLKDNSIIDISGFEKPSEVAEYIFNNNFTHIACRMDNCDTVKTILRELEQRELSKRL